MSVGYIYNLLLLSSFVFSIMSIMTNSVILFGFCIVVYSIAYDSLVHFKIINNEGIWFSLFVIGVYYTYLASPIIFFHICPVLLFIIHTGLFWENDYISVMFFLIISVILFFRRKKVLNNIDKYLYVLFLMFFPTIRHHSRIIQNEIWNEYLGLGAWMYAFNYNSLPWKCRECAEGKITIFNDFWLGMQFLSIILGLTVFIVILYFRKQNICTLPQKSDNVQLDKKTINL